MSLYEGAVKRPIMTSLVFLAVVILGVFSALKLPIDLFPDIDTNTIMIMTYYNGASANDIENNVKSFGKKIEGETRNASDKLEDKSREKSSDVENSVKDFGKKAENEVKNASNKVEDKSRELAGNVKDSARDVKDRSKELSDDVKDSATDAKNTTKEKFDDVRNAAKGAKKGDDNKSESKSGGSKLRSWLKFGDDLDESSASEVDDDLEEIRK